MFLLLFRATHSSVAATIFWNTFPYLEIILHYKTSLTIRNITLLKRRVHTSSTCKFFKCKSNKMQIPTTRFPILKMQLSFILNSTQQRNYVQLKCLALFDIDCSTFLISLCTEIRNALQWWWWRDDGDRLLWWWPALICCVPAQVFPCRHIGSHALPKVISRSQSQGAYSGTVPESIFLMAL